MRSQWLLACIALPLAAAPAWAQQRTITVTTNRAEMIRLDKTAGTVLVANPAIADVVVEAGQQLFILGRSPGETQLYVLDGEGKTLLSAVLAVRPPAANHLSIVRGTDEATVHCAPRCAPTGTVNVSPGGGAASPTAPAK